MKGALRRLDARARDGVERASSNGPPTAFRIWKAGLNTTDKGPTVFSKRSAKLLLAEQTARGNRYSVDVNHLSLNPDAPIANQRAVGFFSLEVRDDELWAVGCEWSDTVRDGLTKDPPEWKYFSPAYDVDPKTREVISFLNCALTNTPATHRVTALASSASAEGKSMKKCSEIVAALMGDDEEKKSAAMAALQAAFPDEDEKKDDESKKDADDGEESKKDSADEAPESKKDSADDKEEKKDAVQASSASLVAEQDEYTRKLESRIAKIEKDAEDKERVSLIASRVMSDALAKKLSTKPLAYVRDICNELPKKERKDLAAAAKVQATRGEGQTDANASRLSPDEKRALDERMGLAPRRDSIRREGNAVVFGVMTREDAKERAAAKGVK